MVTWSDDNLTEEEKEKKNKNKNWLSNIKKFKICLLIVIAILVICVITPWPRPHYIQEWIMPLKSIIMVVCVLLIFWVLFFPSKEQATLFWIITTVVASMFLFWHYVLSSQTDLRAWVSPNSYKLLQEEPLKVLVCFINKGKTPALEVKQNEFVWLSVGPETEKNLDSKCKEMNHTTNDVNVAFPNIQYPKLVSSEVKLSPEQIKAIHERKAYVYVLGEISYKEIFSPIPFFDFERLTTFCVYHRPGLEKGIFEPCPCAKCNSAT